jgi:hypothetical protein
MGRARGRHRRRRRAQHSSSVNAKITDAYDVAVKYSSADMLALNSRSSYQFRFLPLVYVSLSAAQSQLTRATTTPSRTHTFGVDVSWRFLVR